MVVKFLVEVIADIDVYPEDMHNADTIGDYKAELDCNVENAALDYCIDNLNYQADINLLYAEPYDTGIEDYGNLLNNWLKHHESTSIKKNLGTSMGL